MKQILDSVQEQMEGHFVKVTTLLAIPDAGIELIHGQQYILLVGGFGDSPYLRRQFQNSAVFKDVEITQTNDLTYALPQIFYLLCLLTLRTVPKPSLREPPSGTFNIRSRLAQLATRMEWRSGGYTTSTTHATLEGRSHNTRKEAISQEYGASWFRRSV